MKSIRFLGVFISVAGCLLLLGTSCTSVDLYEKSVAIPGHAWKSSFKPSFSFTIKDTTVPYQFYLVLRHTEQYRYTNIYINLYLQPPGNAPVQTIRMPLTLATNEGWLGSGMDDIYEHRIPLAEKQTLKAGTYQFTIEQIMREDPLDHVLNVGLRIEKKP